MAANPSVSAITGLQTPVAVLVDAFFLLPSGAFRSLGMYPAPALPQRSSTRNRGWAETEKRQLRTPDTNRTARTEESPAGFTIHFTQPARGLREATALPYYCTTMRYTAPVYGSSTGHQKSHLVPPGRQEATISCCIYPTRRLHSLPL